MHTQGLTHFHGSQSQFIYLSINTNMSVQFNIEFKTNTAKTMKSTYYF